MKAQRPVPQTLDQMTRRFRDKFFARSRAVEEGWNEIGARHGIGEVPLGVSVGPGWPSLPT
jgi:hypothetical protein